VVPHEDTTVALQADQHTRRSGIVAYACTRHPQYLENAKIAAMSAHMQIQRTPIESLCSPEFTDPDISATIIEFDRFDWGDIACISDIRKINSAIPLISMIPKADIDQRIALRTLGSDHIVVDPVDEREIAAILRNAARIAGIASSQVPPSESDRKWKLQPARWTLAAPNEITIRLSRGEYAVLEKLILNAGVAVPRSELLSIDDARRTNIRTLDVLLSRLRRKVWECAGIELPIRSSRNYGYIFARQDILGL
jgi:DNA-binding response OmpR family regulator